MERRKTRKLSILVKLLIPTAFIVFMATAALSITSYMQLQESLISVGVENAEMAANIAVDVVDGDVLSTLKPGDEGTEAYQSIYKELRRAKETCGILYLYTLYVEDGVVYYGVDCSDVVSTYGEKVFYSAYDSENPPKFAIDPRGWEQVSDIIYDNNGVLARELIVNKVGEQIASSLIEYAQTPQITLEDILNDNYFPEDLPRKFDARYALALSLRSVTMEQITTVRKFVKRLGPEILSAFDVAWVNNDDEKALYLASLQDKEIEQEL